MIFNTGVFFENVIKIMAKKKSLVNKYIIQIDIDQIYYCAQHRKKTIYATPKKSVIKLIM